MKKLFIFLTLFLFVNTYSVPLGPWLNRLMVDNILHNQDRSKFVINAFPRQGIYQLQTLDQGNTNACVRHAIKNLIFTMNAFARQKKFRIKQGLRQIFNSRKFNRINRILCAHVGITDILQQATGHTKINTLLADLQNGKLQRKYPQLNNILPKNLHNIMSKSTTQSIAPFKPKSVVKIFYGQFKTDKDIVEILNGYIGGKELLRKIYDFRTSNNRILGIPLTIANDLQLKIFTHEITVIINKKNNNNFELFMLDSCNHNPPSSWLQPLRFIRHLVNLPTNRLMNIINSPDLINYTV